MQGASELGKKLVDRFLLIDFRCLIAIQPLHWIPRGWGTLTFQIPVGTQYLFSEIKSKIGVTETSAERSPVGGLCDVVF